MIGLDTNILVRYIVQDDPHQTATAVAFMDSLTSQNQGFVSLVTVAELCWVLNRTYKLSRIEFSGALQILLDSDELLIEGNDLVKEALRLFSKSKADFDDCLIERCSRAAGCTSIATFDKNAAKALGMQLLT